MVPVVNGAATVNSASALRLYQPEDSMTRLYAVLMYS
jgi:hypothetical protein